MRKLWPALACSLLSLGSPSLAQVKSVNAPVNDPLGAATAERAAKAYDASKTEALNLRQVGWNDLAARTAYQPTIKQQGARWLLYVGHHGGRTLNPLNNQQEENGTSILDVTDVSKPKLLFHIPGEKGREAPGRETGGAQMARVCGGGELPNADPSKFYLLRTFGESGQEIWDVTTPEKPSLVWRIDGFRSTHKNDWDCRSGIALLVHSGADNRWNVQRVTNIYDLSNPEKPVKIREVSLPEHVKDGGVNEPTAPLHGALLGGPELNRVFFGYGTNKNGAAVIVDRDKMLKGGTDISAKAMQDIEIGRATLPEFLGAHTAYPLYGMEPPAFAHDSTVKKRNFLVVVNENNVTACAEARQMAFFIDVTDERHPFGVASYEPDERSGNFCDRGGRFGAHSSNESRTPAFYGRLMFFTWFNAGVRMVDVRDPYKPREVGYFIPARNASTDYRCDDEKERKGCVPVIQMNNVEVDDRGFVYAVDRANSGLFILEVTGEPREQVRPRN
ncbi:MAG: hypothetical protein JWO64_1407 [Hyphomicrobiales bacterium]|nr:hypothetical protein [Hyphomicrobiales bacterium]